MPDPDIPARPAPYTGGINTHYPGASIPESTTRLPLVASGTQGKGYAQGWLRPILRLIKPSGGRTGVLSTDRELHTGPAPQMIVRQFADLSHGLTGPGVSSFPMTAGGAYMPHQNINRRTAGKAVSNPARKFDDNVQVPAIYAGNVNNG